MRGSPLLVGCCLPSARGREQGKGKGLWLRDRPVGDGEMKWRGEDAGHVVEVTSRCGGACSHGLRRRGCVVFRSTRKDVRASSQHVIRRRFLSPTSPVPRYTYRDLPPSPPPPRVLLRSRRAAHADAYGGSGRGGTPLPSGKTTGGRLQAGPMKNKQPIGPRGVGGPS